MSNSKLLSDGKVSTINRTNKPAFAGDNYNEDTINMSLSPNTMIKNPESNPKFKQSPFFSPGNEVGPKELYIRDDDFKENNVL